MASFIRQSKYRHVFGEELPEKFEDIKSTALASEGTLVVSNGKYVAFCWDSAGPGVLSVLSIKNELGRIPAGHPLIKGHTSTITDFEFNPFNENEIITGCDDSLIRLWGLPDNRLTEDIVSPIATLQGHGKKITLLNFHPSAAYVLASTGQDKTVKVWSVERSTAVLTHGGLQENLVSLKWSPEGKNLAFTSRDKFARGVDPRSNTQLFEFIAHDGLKPSKVSWINEQTLVTCGFAKSGDRQVGIWDLRNSCNSLKHMNIDQGSGVLYPFYDPDTTLLFLAGKGDGNVRYYEVVGDSNYLYLLDSFKSTTPCKGISFTPKYTVDTSVCEIMKAVKLTNSSVDLISFKVPRISDSFQTDLYPDCVSNIPAMNGSEWFDVSSVSPSRIPIQEVRSANTHVEIKESKTTAEYERELAEAHKEISRLNAYIRELESKLAN